MKQRVVKFNNSKYIVDNNIEMQVFGPKEPTVEQVEATISDTDSSTSSYETPISDSPQNSVSDSFASDDEESSKVSIAEACKANPVKISYKSSLANSLGKFMSSDSQPYLTNRPKVLVVGDSASAEIKKQFLDCLLNEDTKSVYKATLGVDHHFFHFENKIYQLCDLSSQERFGPWRYKDADIVFLFAKDLASLQKTYQDIQKFLTKDNKKAIYCFIETAQNFNKCQQIYDYLCANNIVTYESTQPDVMLEKLREVLTTHTATFASANIRVEEKRQRGFDLRS